jgi:hypothetical protein
MAAPRLMMPGAGRTRTRSDLAFGSPARPEPVL